MAAISDTVRASPLLRLPSEMLQAILALVDPLDLSSIGQTCQRFHQECNSDLLWYGLVRDSIPASVKSPKPFHTWRELFLAHYPFWFIPRAKIWFSDHAAVGKLIISRYDPRRGCIEAYALAAARRSGRRGVLELGGYAQYQTFEPRLQLDLDQPILRLDPTPPHRSPVGSSATSPGAASSKLPFFHSPYASRTSHRPCFRRLREEFHMDIHHATSDNLVSRLLLARRVPDRVIHPSMSLWPPPLLPALPDSRVRAESPSKFVDPSQRPSRFEDLTESCFRIRQWVDFSQLNQPYGIPTFGRLMESVQTYGTLPPACYTPTTAKPYQGIWVGDYSAHGCEFLLVHQPDVLGDAPGSKPALTPAAARAFASWPYNSGPMSALLSGPADTASEALPTPDPAGAESDGETLFRVPQPGAGLLQAIKLTGDPNVPRGECTFIADISERGHVGYTQEDIFKPDARDVDHVVAHDILNERNRPGTRIVRSVGHIADLGFREDTYIPTQLILISPNRLAHYWQPFGHVSFYERVDIDRFVDVWAEPQHGKMPRP